MSRFLAVLTVVLVLAPACGGQHAKSSAVTEAIVEFKRPVALEKVLAMTHLRHIRPTQLVTRFPLLGETITTGVVLDPGMNDREIRSRFRESALGMTDQAGSGLSTFQRTNLKEAKRRLQEAPLTVNQMYVTGHAEDLKTLKDEPSVRSVFLKPSSSCLKKPSRDCLKKQ